MTQLKKHRLFVYGAHYTLEDRVKNSLKGMWGPPRLSKSRFWYATRLDSLSLAADVGCAPITCVYGAGGNGSTSSTGGLVGMEKGGGEGDQASGNKEWSIFISEADDKWKGKHKGEGVKTIPTIPMEKLTYLFWWPQTWCWIEAVLTGDIHGC